MQVLVVGMGLPATSLSSKSGPYFTDLISGHVGSLGFNRSNKVLVSFRK